MPTDAVLPERVELSVSRPENVLLIENRAERVVIRAARDNFSPRQRSFFVRYLAAEGFIPAAYQSRDEPELASCGAPLWLIDHSWLEVPRTQPPKAVRQLIRTVLLASLFWLGLMTFAFLHATH